MTENEGGPAAGPGDSPEPIRDDRDGGDPTPKGSKRPAGERAPDSDDQAAIDLDAVRDRAS